MPFQNQNPVNKKGTVEPLLFCHSFPFLVKTFRIINTYIVITKVLERQPRIVCTNSLRQLTVKGRVYCTVGFHVHGYPLLNLL